MRHGGHGLSGRDGPPMRPDAALQALRAERVKVNVIHYGQAFHALERHGSMWSIKTYRLDVALYSLYLDLVLDPSLFLRRQRWWPSALQLREEMAQDQVARLPKHFACHRGAWQCGHRFQRSGQLDFSLLGEIAAPGAPFASRLPVRSLRGWLAQASGGRHLHHDQHRPGQ